MSALWKVLKSGSLALLLVFGGFGLVGCEEGRFEDAGEEIDEAGDDMEDTIEDAGDELD